MAMGTTSQSSTHDSYLPSGLEKRLPRLDSISLGTPDGSNLSEAATPDLSEMISTMDVSGVSRLANYGDDSREDLSLGKDRWSPRRPQEGVAVTLGGPLHGRQDLSRITSYTSGTK